MQLAVPVPPRHRSFPGASAGYPQRTWSSAHPLHRVSAQASHQPLFDSPPGMLHAALESIRQSSRVSLEPGFARSRAADGVYWLCSLPAASCTPQRRAGTGTSQERALRTREHVWQQRQSCSNPLRPSTAVTLPTHLL